MVKINQKAPEFNVQAFHENDIKKINLNGYRGKWVILVFYPADFTFVCPTELVDLGKVYILLVKIVKHEKKWCAYLCNFFIIFNWLWKG